MNTYFNLQQNNSFLPSPPSHSTTVITSVFLSMRFVFLVSTWVLSFKEMHPVFQEWLQSIDRIECKETIGKTIAITC